MHQSDGKALLVCIARQRHALALPNRPGTYSRTRLISRSALMARFGWAAGGYPTLSARLLPTRGDRCVLDFIGYLMPSYSLREFAAELAGYGCVTPSSRSMLA
jgi:hypothetical protein